MGNVIRTIGAIFVVVVAIVGMIYVYIDQNKRFEENCNNEFGEDDWILDNYAPEIGEEFNCISKNLFESVEEKGAWDCCIRVDEGLIDCEGEFYKKVEFMNNTPSWLEDIDYVNFSGGLNCFNFEDLKGAELDLNSSHKTKYPNRRFKWMKQRLR